jgi:gluconokinase
MTQNPEQASQKSQSTQLKPPYILSLDVGTSSARALLFDANGTTVPDVISQHTYELTTSNQGEVSVDADKLLEVVAQTIDEVLKAAGDKAAQIKAVATDTFWHSLLGVDQSNKPLTPVITWEDTRSHRASLELRSRFDEHAIHERTGARFHASYWPAKLLWLSQEHPGTFKNVDQWISFGEYMHRKFLGNSICSLSMASATGMLVTREKKWDDELIQKLGVRPEQMPKIGDIRDGITSLTAEYAQRWPVLHDVPWFPAIGDGASACIGSGCSSPKNWSLTVGTSSAIRVVIPNGQTVPPDGLWLYLVDGNRAVIGGALSEGGNLFAWLKERLKHDTLDALENEALKAAPDSHGLTILPFISGERSLGWHANSRMTIAGLSIHTSDADLLRAFAEALAFQLSAVYEQLLKALKWQDENPRLFASGGALVKSDFLRSIIADSLGAVIYPSMDHEASARGAALLALESLGLIEDVAQVKLNLTEPTLPKPDNKEAYRKAIQRQAELYNVLLPD